VLKLRPSATPALVQVADINLAKGNPSAAAEFAGQAIKLQPQSGTAHVLLAKSLIRQGNLAGAERQVMGLVKGSPASPDAHVLLGDFYWAKKDLVHARASYDQAFKLQTDSFGALTGLVRVDLAEHKTDAARSRVESQLARTPDDERVLLLAGDLFWTIGDMQRVEATLRHLLQVNPSNIQAYGRLGMLYGSQHRLDEALNEYEDVARRQPKVAVAANTMVGTILTLQNKTEEARKRYQAALALDPQTPVAANNLAWDYAEHGGNLDAALQLAQTAKARLPDTAEISDTLGWVYYKKGLTTLAVTSLEQAASQAPSNPSIRYRLGLAYQKNGDQQKARSSFEEALKLNPQFKEADDARRALATIKG
jgi:tetratricopeptide (TPR) repeat protein